MEREAQVRRLAIVCALAHDPATAQQTGMGLFDNCIGPNKNEVPDLTCTAYFNGFSEAYFALARVVAATTGICLPPEVTPNQIRLITQRYMYEHPERLHMLASRVILDALRGAFPCRSSN
jgi:Rap1a immunity proteins